MECGDTPHFVIFIWIQAWIWIQSMDLHGHCTLHNIHVDTNMDMEYGSTDMDMDKEYGSTSTLHNIHIYTGMDIDMEYGSTWTLHTS